MIKRILGRDLELLGYELVELVDSAVELRFRGELVGCYTQFVRIEKLIEDAYEDLDKRLVAKGYRLLGRT